MSLMSPKLHLDRPFVLTVPTAVTETARLAWGVLLIAASVVCIVVGQGTGPERPPLLAPRPRATRGAAG